MCVSFKPMPELSDSMECNRVTPESSSCKQIRAEGYHRDHDQSTKEDTPTLPRLQQSWFLQGSQQQLPAQLPPTLPLAANLHLTHRAHSYSGACDVGIFVENFCKGAIQGRFSAQFHSGNAIFKTKV